MTRTSTRSGLARWRAKLVAIGVAVGGMAAARRVVEIVELADRGDPGQRHLGNRDRQAAIGNVVHGGQGPGANLLADLL